MNYLITDHLSSVVAVTDSSGLLLEETRYMPFGAIRSDVGSVTTTDKSFTGQKVLPDTGLLDYNARMYSSYLNRWTQPDTIIPNISNPQDWNRYGYARNNPINFNDPSGHDVGCSAANPACQDSNGLTEESKAEMRLSVSKRLKKNGWDNVPIVSNVRGITRGIQIMDWAAYQQEFMEQQIELQNWQTNCYGKCHYAHAIENGPVPATTGGPMPETPIVDIYSEGGAEVVGNAIDIGLTIALGKVTRGLPELKLDTPKFGIRIAPFGNEGSGPWVSKLSHFHFRVGPEYGKSYTGLGWRWHHPWEDITRLWKLLQK